MEDLPDEIASLVLSTFDGLERKRKPLQRQDGVKEWVPLSGIVAQRESVLGSTVR
jgi:tRNA-specific adenosine deaminase 1